MRATDGVDGCASGDGGRETVVRGGRGRRRRGKTKTAIEEAPTKTEVGTKRPRAEDADEDEAEAREVRGRPAETETRDGKEEKETTTTESGFGAPSSGGGGFGSALSGAGFGGFGGLKSGGGFGGFAAANANAGVGFASKASTPAFGGAAAAPVALFGAGKKEAEEEDGDDDPEREVANDSIKPIVELEVVETKTGEEDETCTFRTEGALFEYVVDKEKGSRWMERGRGDVRLNQGKNRYGLSCERRVTSFDAQCLSFQRSKVPTDGGRQGCPSRASTPRLEMMQDEHVCTQDARGGFKCAVSGGEFSRRRVQSD